MAITIKTSEEIEKMRKAGKILAQILTDIENFTEIGKTTKDLDNFAETLMKKYNVKPSFKNYHGFPAILCTSVNEQVVHTIPSDYVLKDGDILTVDCGIIHEGFHSDSALTILLGNVPEKTKEFVFVVRKALNQAIDKIKDGVHLNAIGSSIQKVIEGQHGYSIVKELTGHGIGRNLHEDPFIVNFREISPGPMLKAGMTLAIEPIVAMGSGQTITLNDNWTIVTADKMPACQWEHTILVTKDGAEVLTKR
jgi:methionyl aminopeptidase